MSPVDDELCGVVREASCHPGDAEAVRYAVKSCRIDRRGMKIGSRAGIAEVLAVRLFIAIVVVEPEVGFAAFVALFVVPRPLRGRCLHMRLL